MTDFVLLYFQWNVRNRSSLFEVLNCFFNVSKLSLSYSKHFLWQIIAFSAVLQKTFMSSISKLFSRCHCFFDESRDSQWTTVIDYMNIIWISPFMKQIHKMNKFKDVDNKTIKLLSKRYDNCQNLNFLLN